MLIKSISRVALASALIFAFTACSDDGSESTDFDDTATTADTEEAAEDAAEMLADVTYSLNFGSPEIFLSTSASARRFLAKHPSFGGNVAAGIQQNGIAVPGLSVAPNGKIQYAAAPGCTIESSGTDGDPFDPYDGNENGIPDDWHAKQVCVSSDTSDPSNVITERTTIEMSAKENTAALHGYSAKMHYEVRMSDEEGNALGVEFNGSDVLDIRGSGASQKYSFDAREYSTDEGETEEAKGGEERNVSFDPDGTIVLGDDLPDGELSFDGRQWFANTDDVALSFRIETTEALAFESACFDDTDPPFTDGTVVGHLNGQSNSATFSITFSDCGVYTIDVDNTSDEPAIASHRRPTGTTVAVVPRRQ